MKKEGKEKTQTNRILKEVGLQLEGKQEKHPWPGVGGEWKKGEQYFMWQRTAGTLGLCTKHRCKRVFWNLTFSSEHVNTLQ